MNTGIFSARRQRAFTLIELLIVIAIVAVLAGLLFPAVIQMQRMAKRKRTAVQAASITHALKEYRTTYSRWPGQTQGALDGVATPAAVLSALTDNPRNVTYINLRPGDVAGGVFVDPYNRPFVIAMDENGDGNVNISATLGALTYSTNVANQTACVMSWGRVPEKDKERVISWQQ
jgi:general secretion pathway protein G